VSYSPEAHSVLGVKGLLNVQSLYEVKTRTRLFSDMGGLEGLKLKSSVKKMC
jgi:hypothetical protein